MHKRCVLAVNRPCGRRLPECFSQRFDPTRGVVLQRELGRQKFGKQIKDKADAAAGVQLSVGRQPDRKNDGGHVG